MIDGVPSAPENMSDNNIVNGQSSQDVTLSFVIPESATKVELEVGKPDIQQTAKNSHCLEGNASRSDCSVERHGV